jgi:hypothetical protein
MGANATTFVPAYVAGEVLTAADLSVTNSGIPVFADGTARDAAFGGTGEKVLAEGQYAYLESTNATQFYDGAAWQAVGVSPGMVLVGSASPSAVSSVSINNCFTSTYENYRVVGTVSAATGATAGLTMRLRVAGTDTTTNYTCQLFEMYSATATSTLNPQGTDEWYLSNIDTTTDDTVFSYDIYAPQTATKTRYTGQAMYTTSVFVSQAIAGVQTAATQFDGFTILFAGTNFTGNIRVYGYANS